MHFVISRLDKAILKGLIVREHVDRVDYRHLRYGACFELDATLNKSQGTIDYSAGRRRVS